MKYTEFTSILLPSSRSTTIFLSLIHDSSMMFCFYLFSMSSLCLRQCMVFPFLFAIIYIAKYVNILAASWQHLFQSNFNWYHFNFILHLDCIYNLLLFVFLSFSIVYLTFHINIDSFIPFSSQFKIIFTPFSYYLCDYLLINNR